MHNVVLQSDFKRIEHMLLFFLPIMISQKVDYFRAVVTSQGITHILSNQLGSVYQYIYIVALSMSCTFCA